MGLRFLDHILILTHAPDATRDWFVECLGLRDGPHPEFGFPVHWLYIGERAVIHIAQARHSQHQDTYMQAPGDRPQADGAPAAAPGSGRIDHVCLDGEGLQDFMQRLADHGVEFSERKAQGSEVYQLFLREPVNGIKIELNFPWQEAVRLGRLPAATGAGASGRSADAVRT